MTASCSIRKPGRGRLLPCPPRPLLQGVVLSRRGELHSSALSLPTPLPTSRTRPSAHSLRRIIVHSSLLLSLLALLLSSCGSSHSAASSIAVAGGDPITRSDLQAYMDYTVRFYAWAHHTSTDLISTCHVFDRKAGCPLLQQQALSRLIEEKVVLAYARDHHIQLSAADRSRIQRDLAQLQTASGGTSLLTKLHASSAFMQSLLTTQLLVQKVEDAVSPPSARSGPSFHVRKFLVPAPSGRARGTAHGAALTLATDGNPVPSGTRVSVEWVASFRLSHPLKHLLSLAEPGQYLGPLLQRSSYLVVQLLGKGRHSYGRPARQELTTRYFKSWLAQALHGGGLHCYSASGRTVPCPL